MPRSPLFGDLLRTLRLARQADAESLSSRTGLDRAAEAAQRPSRRGFILGAGAVAATAAMSRGLAGCSSPDPLGKKSGALSGTGPRVAIVGAGLAGLVCADRLQAKGIVATVYESNATRVGGRCYSNRKWAGHVGEAGGEMIDNGGKTMLDYAREFGLAVEDYNKEPGKVLYYSSGALWSEADIVDQWRVLVTRAKADLSKLSPAPTALKHTDADVALDRLDLQTWLDTRAGDLPQLRAALTAAYISEYGRDPHEQSCLNLLLFMHLDRRSHFNPYGSSDERYHIVGGNDQVATKLAARLTGGVEMGRSLIGLSKNSVGEFVLTFKTGAPVTADVVVLAIPFTVLRGITLDTSLGLSAEKTNAINNLGYGYNGKTEIVFNGRPWAALGSNGSIYADLPNLQNTWETNWTASDSQTILTDYFGGTLGWQRQMLSDPGGPRPSCGSCHSSFPKNPPIVDAQVAKFLADLDKVIPGASAAVARNLDGTPMVHRGHWLPQSQSKGSYTCYLPGQFTSISGLEGTSVGNLLFAGEHTDSFYAWQGFLEGAARSGAAAAAEILGNHGGGIK
jgi:monoamine oxidase